MNFVGAKWPFPEILAGYLVTARSYGQQSANDDVDTDKTHTNTKKNAGKKKGKKMSDRIPKKKAGQRERKGGISKENRHRWLKNGLYGAPWSIIQREKNENDVTVGVFIGRCTVGVKVDTENQNDMGRGDRNITYYGAWK